MATQVRPHASPHILDRTACFRQRPSHRRRGLAPALERPRLASWTTWLAKPHASAVLHDAPRDAKGNFSQPIGPNRDPLGVFSVVNTDGQPAIRISGQVFGEPRSTAAFTDYRLRLQFKWGEKKGPPRETAETPRDSGLLYHVHAEPGAEGRTWARSIEIQIQERDVGALSAIGAMI